MNSSRSRLRVLLTILAGVSLALAVCGASVLEEADIEAEAARELAATTGEDEPNIDCPGDLEAEVGKSMECELTVEGDDTVLPVTVTVTEIDGNNAKYEIEVGQPEGGDESTDDTPIEGDAPIEGEDETRPADGEELPGEEGTPADGPAE